MIVGHVARQFALAKFQKYMQAQRKLGGEEKAPWSALSSRNPAIYETSEGQKPAQNWAKALLVFRRKEKILSGK